MEGKKKAIDNGQMMMDVGTLKPHTCWVYKLHWCLQKGQVEWELPRKGLSNSNGLTISTSPYVHI